jgi:hypothetical protein
MLSPHTQNNKKKNYTTLIQGKKKTVGTGPDIAVTAPIVPGLAAVPAGS